MAKTKQSTDNQIKMDFGLKLLGDKTEDFKKQAIVRFTEFDRLMNLTSPSAGLYVVGYPIIVANLEGEFQTKAEELEIKKSEAEVMMTKLQSMMGGIK